MFEQVKLSYDVNALEPHIDQLTIETHYGKHHAAYTKTFNELAEKAGMAGMPVEELLASLDKVADETLRKGLRNQGGGYYNHNLYFTTLAPLSENVHEPAGALAEQINKQFGSLEKLKEELKGLALSQFGSGWAWLSKAPDGSLVTSKSLNQDNPISEGSGNTPIFCIDVWEHA